MPSPNVKRIGPMATGLVGAALAVALTVAGFMLLDEPAPPQEVAAGDVAAVEPPGKPAGESAPPGGTTDEAEAPAAATADDAGGPEDAGTAATGIVPPEPAASASSGPLPPEITTWAVTAAGAATIAGQATPGALVRILLDGDVVAETRATPGGEFAVVTTLAPDPAPRLMTLVMVLEDGREVPSAASVALGPVSGPVIAAAEGEAGPAEAPPAIMVTDEGALVLQEAAVAAAPERAVAPATDEAPAVEGTAGTGAGAEGAAPEPAQAETRPAAVVPVTIETIAYNAAGDVQLGGRGEPDAFLRLYLDNVPLRDLAVAPDGNWLVTLEGIEPGLYTLRADQLDDGGKVTARFETPFRRETREALAAASGKTTGEASQEGASPAPDVPVTIEDGTSPPVDLAAAADAEATPAVAGDSVPAASEVPDDGMPTLPEPVAGSGADTETAAELPSESPAASPGAGNAGAPVAALPAISSEGPELSLAEPAGEPALSEEDSAPAAGSTDTGAVADAEGAAGAAASPGPEVVTQAPETPEAPAIEAMPASPAVVEEGGAPIAAPEAPTAPEAPGAVTITVQPGYTLWAIARRELGAGILYVQVFDANRDKIRDPNLIYPGQVFAIPGR